MRRYSYSDSKSTAYSQAQAEERSRLGCREVRVVSFIREEQRDSCSSTGGIIVRELCQRQEIGPVVLLVVVVNPKVLLQGLIGLLCLSVAFGMVARCEMELHVEHGPKQAEKVQDEFSASVGSDTGRNSVFQEDVQEE